MIRFDIHAPDVEHRLAFVGPDAGGFGGAAVGIIEHILIGIASDNLLVPGQSDQLPAVPDQ